MHIDDVRSLFSNLSVGVCACSLCVSVFLRELKWAEEVVPIKQTCFLLFTSNRTVWINLGDKQIIKPLVQETRYYYVRIDGSSRLSPYNTSINISRWIRPPDVSWIGLELCDSFIVTTKRSKLSNFIFRTRDKNSFLKARVPGFWIRHSSISDILNHLSGWTNQKVKGACDVFGDFYLSTLQEKW